MTKLPLTKVEKWEGLAWSSFFWAIALSICGAFCIWQAPKINIHSSGAILALLGIFAVGLANAIAGAVGVVSASVLFVLNRVVSWYGIAAGLIVGLFFVCTW